VIAVPTFGAMPRAFRSMLFGLLLGFHNAWEQDDASLEELGAGLYAAYREPMGHPLARPGACFFWGSSSLLN